MCFSSTNNFFQTNKNNLGKLYPYGDLKLLIFISLRVPVIENELVIRFMEFQERICGGLQRWRPCKHEQTFKQRRTKNAKNTKNKKHKNFPENTKTKYSPMAQKGKKTIACGEPTKKKKNTRIIFPKSPVRVQELIIFT